MDSEVERTFFFHPEHWSGKPTKTTPLEQGYLPATGDWEVQLQRMPSDCRYTMKTGVGLDREEWEIRVSRPDFDRLWPKTEGRRIEKVRERHHWRGQAVDVDRYSSTLEGLIVVEVEFPNLDRARSFHPPKAFGPELTYDSRYRNHALAQNPVEVPLTIPRNGLGWSYGVLPFRKSPRGWELVLVSTRRRDRWIFPKGQPESGQSPEKVAWAEAQEEAGLTGRRVGHPLVFPYVRETGTTNLLLFPMQVTSLADRWLESEQRSRKVVPVSEAQEYGELAQMGALWIKNQG